MAFRKKIWDLPLDKSFNGELASSRLERIQARARKWFEEHQ